MDVDNWAEFGKNMVVSNDFDYFPERWTNLDGSEKFINYALRYKEDFNHGENFEVLYSFDFLDFLDSKYDGFYKLKKGKVIVDGFPHGADFAFLKEGVLKYSQKKYLWGNGSQIFSQTFYDKPFFLKKIYYQSKYRSSPLRLSNVLRGESFLWNEGSLGAVSQFNKNNFEVSLYKNLNLGFIIGFHLNSQVSYQDSYFIDQIKKNSFSKREDFLDFLNEMWEGGVRSTLDEGNPPKDLMDPFIRNIY